MASPPPPWLNLEIAMTDLMTLLRRQTAERPLPTMQAMPADDLLAGADAPVECGWYESSWDLRHGLSVKELPSDDLAALWFPGLGDSRAVPVRLQ